MSNNEQQVDEPIVRTNYKTVAEIERILEECIRIAKDNQHMINETCNHIINRNRKRNKGESLITKRKVTLTSSHMTRKLFLIENHSNNQFFKQTDPMLLFLLPKRISNWYR